MKRLNAGRMKVELMPKKKQRGTLYLTDTRVILLIPENGKEFTLEELQQAVGGYIELVTPLNRYSTVYVNEEGLIHGLPVNPHDQTVVKLSVYPRGTRMVGNMISTYRVPEDELADTDKGRVTVKEALSEIPS